MLGDDDNVLFVRGNDKDNDANDIWDDSVLIKAYDKAVNFAKEEVAKRISLETSSTHVKSNKSKQQDKKTLLQKIWTVGSPCRAIYSVDNKEYEAIISHVFDNNSGSCIVKFIGYNNTEKVSLSSLRESEGLASQTAQAREAEVSLFSENDYSDQEQPQINYQQSSSRGDNDEKMNYTESQTPRETFSNNYHDFGGFPTAGLSSAPPAPPIPPQFMARLPTNDADALSSMLMSWYMSGFHTGYYHGMKQAEKNNTNRRKK